MRWKKLCCLVFPFRCKSHKFWIEVYFHFITDVILKILSASKTRHQIWIFEITYTGWAFLLSLQVFLSIPYLIYYVHSIWIFISFIYSLVKFRAANVILLNGKLLCCYLWHSLRVLVTYKQRLMKNSIFCMVDDNLAGLGYTPRKRTWFLPVTFLSDKCCHCS